MFKLLNIHVVIVWGGTGEDNTRDKCGTPGISVVTHRGQPPEGGAVVVSSAVAVLLSSAAQNYHAVVSHKPFQQQYSCRFY